MALIWIAGGGIIFFVSAQFRRVEPSTLNMTCGAGLLGICSGGRLLQQLPSHQKMKMALVMIGNTMLGGAFGVLYDLLYQQLGYLSGPTRLLLLGTIFGSLFGFTLHTIHKDRD